MIVFSPFRQLLLLTAYLDKYTYIQNLSYQHIPFGNVPTKYFYITCFCILAKLDEDNVNSMLRNIHELYFSMCHSTKCGLFPTTSTSFASQTAWDLQKSTLDGSGLLLHLWQVKTWICDQLINQLIHFIFSIKFCITCSKKVPTLLSHRTLFGTIYFRLRYLPAVNK